MFLCEMDSILTNDLLDAIREYQNQFDKDMA